MVSSRERSEDDVTVDIIGLIQRLNQLNPVPDYPDDEAGIYCCRLALDALEQGSYGVAAVLIDPDGAVVAQSENQVFSSANSQDVFNSRAHAEMLLVDQLESGAVSCRPERLTMLVTLEPCPMCLARLLLSGVGSIRYIARDPDGGMLTHSNQLPPAWRNLSLLQNHYEACVSEPVRTLAREIGSANLHQLRSKLFKHIRP